VALAQKKESKLQGEIRELSMIHSFSRVKFAYSTEQFRYTRKVDAWRSLRREGLSLQMELMTK
jgi:hypothetical protein